MTRAILLTVALLCQAALGAVSVDDNEATATGASTSITFAKPEGATAGDVLLSFITTSNDTAMPTPPTGWICAFWGSATVGTDRSGGVFYKVLTAADASVTSYTWTQAYALTFSGGIVRVTGADAFMPLDGVYVQMIGMSPAGRSRVTYKAGGDWANAADEVCPSLTTTRNGSVVLCYVGLAGGTVTTATAPAGATKVIDSRSSSLSSTIVAYYTQTNAGATGDKAFAITASGAEWITLQVALRPAATHAWTGPFYVDPVNGSDNNDGVASDSAWQHIDYAFHMLHGAGPWTINLMTGTQAQYGASNCYRPGQVYTLTGSTQGFDSVAFGHGMAAQAAKDSWSVGRTVTQMTGQTARPERIKLFGELNSYTDFTGLTIPQTEREPVANTSTFDGIEIISSSYVKVTDCTISGYWEMYYPEDLSYSSDTCITINGSSNVTIHGCDLSEACFNVSVEGAWSDVVIEDCDVHDWAQSCLRFPEYHALAGGVTMQRNTFFNYRSHPVHGGSGIGLRCNNGIIRNNLIVSHGGSGTIRFYQNAAGNGSVVPGGHSHWLIEGNIVHSNSYSTNLIYAPYLGHDITIRNNTFLCPHLQTTASNWFLASNTFGLDSAATGANIAIHNNVFGSTTGMSSAFKNNAGLSWGNNYIWSYALDGTIQATPPAATDILAVVGINSYASGFTSTSLTDAGTTFVGHPNDNIWGIAFTYMASKSQTWAWPLLPSSTSVLVGAGDPSHVQTDNKDYFGATRGNPPCIGALEYIAGSAPAAMAGFSPSNGASAVNANADISWSASSGAEGYDVSIIATDSDPDITAWKGEQTALSYEQGAMEDGTTYYWRATAWNHAGSADSGVKSFTVGGEAPTPEPAVASNPSPADSASLTSAPSQLTWTAGDRTTSNVVYWGTDSSPDETELLAIQDANSYALGTQIAGTYYWSIIERNGTGDSTSNPVWSYTILDSASAPSPTTGATGQTISLNLSWTAADSALSHNVYLGTSLASVTAATTGTAGIYKGNQAGTSYSTGTLSYGRVYYWRVDEVFAGDNVVKGTVWSFRTKNRTKLFYFRRP